MNVKGEKIEQIIQIINRNLLLVQAGQENSVTPLEFRNLQRIDAGVFGTDKFAFEMVHFVKSSSENRPPEGSLLFKWEKSFLKGLETLLVECGVVKDEIERDCFVSRVYCWFSEKLSERRDLPRPPLDSNSLQHLKSTVVSMTSDNVNSLKALDNYSVQNAANSTAPQSGSLRKGDDHDMFVGDGGLGPSGGLDETSQTIAMNSGNKKNPSKLKGIHSHSSNELPIIPQILSGPAGNRPKSQGQMNSAARKNMYETQINSLLPKLPGSENNYGMLYHKPESESELQMHEMWLARRRQEAFDWKAQQQITLLMDRIGLHKSRVESEALRRQESGSYLSATVNSPDKRAGMDHDQTSPTLANGKSASKFVPIITGDRPLSAKRHNALVARQLAGMPDQYDGLSDADGTGYYSSDGGGGGRHMQSPGSPSGGGLTPAGNSSSSISRNRNRNRITNEYDSERGSSLTVGRSSVDGDRGEEDNGVADTTIQLSGANTGVRSADSAAVIAKASRNTVTKIKTVSREYVPMRFKADSVAVKIQQYDRQHYYMQGDDSDEEDADKNARTARSRTAGTASGGRGSTAGSGTMNSSSSIGQLHTSGSMTPSGGAFVGTMRAARLKHYKDRPASSKKLKEIVFNDPEAKVHYRHTNYRRMPLTIEQAQWIAGQEDDRHKRHEEHLKKLAEEAAAKKAKKKDAGAKKGGGKKDSKGGKKKDDKAKKEVVVEKPKNKYKSPAHFMAKNFPTFDMGESCKISHNKPPTAASLHQHQATGSSSLSGTSNADGTHSMNSGMNSGMATPNTTQGAAKGSNYNVYNMSDIADDNYGPMRTMQMVECNRIMDVCADWEVPMDEKILYRALVIPQDKPLAITVEQGFHNPSKSLMPNPLPKEYWKTIPSELLGGAKKKKGGGKKKKK